MLSKEERQANYKAARENHDNTRQATWENNRLARATRTPAEQLRELDFRLGKGVGAKKERARLTQQRKAG